ncbi:hypothetical protein FQN54_003414 [Arachnomyces sp. PD_36]|nr:hypothetical protein FQN54_003414 [Arachnomyces sp. PD_36]
MRTLDDLPDEILVNIIERIDGIQDFAALSAQCRRLYRIVDMPVRRRYHRIRYSSEQHALAYTLLIEILKNPRLGRYVRELEINTSLDLRYYRRRNQEPAANQKLLYSAMEAAGVDLSKLDEYHCKGLEGMLCITLCPNIRSLRIREHPYPPAEMILTRANAKGATSGYLQNLKEVQILCDYEQGNFRDSYYNDFDFAKMIKFFHRLPSIQTVRVGGIHVDEEPTTILLPKKSNVSRIIMENSVTFPNILEQIIRHPKALEVFQYTIGGRHNIDSEFAPSIPAQLGRALQYQKSTLRVLDLDTDTELIWPDAFGRWFLQQSYADFTNVEDDSDLDDEDNVEDFTSPPLKVDPSIGSFHDFTSLTHLSIGITLLTGRVVSMHRPGGNYPPPPIRLVDSLPPSLEFLCIRGYREGEDAYLTSMVSELMERRAERFPRLKEVQGVSEYVENGSSLNLGSEPQSVYEEPEIWRPSSDWQVV